MTDKERQISKDAASGKVIQLGTWSMDPDALPLIKKCSMCETEHDLSKMSPEAVTRLYQVAMIADVAVQIFELISQTTDRKTPLMQKVASFNRDTGEDVFSIDLWTGIGGMTPISRLAEKNALIVELNAELEQLRALNK